MRIALFDSSLPVPERKPGGVEVFVHRLANRLSAAGHEVTVLSFSPAPPDARYALRRLRPAWFAGSAFVRMSLVPLVLNFVDTSDFDVLHLHGDDWFFVRRRLPTVRTFYGSARAEARTATTRRRRIRQHVIARLERLSARLATVAYTINPEEVRRPRLRGSLPLGVDLPDRSDWTRSPEPTVLFVGTWEGRKRGRFLRDLLVREILPHVPEARLWMVTDACEESAAVQWFGQPSDEALTDLYRRAWVFCLPSTYEGFGIPYLEAMAQGTPVVASSNPGSRYLLEGGAGEIADDAALGETLRALLTQGERREALARVGRERAGDFSWPRVVASHERAYAAALAESAQRSPCWSARTTSTRG